MANFVEAVACPPCQSRGNDKKGNNRILYDDGGHYCFSCGDFKTGSSSHHHTTPEYNTLPMYTTESILSSRGIAPEVIKDYGVTTVQDSSGQLYVKFPFHDVNRVETNFQIRAVDTSDGSLTKTIKFSPGKIKLPLFGWRLVSPATKTLVVCEGLTDALYFASHYHNSETVVLGMGSAANAKRCAAHLLEYDKDYKIVVAFDNDEAGKLATDNFVEYFSVHNEDKVIYKLSIPEPHKDIADWGADAVVLGAAIVNSYPVSLSGVLGAEEISTRVGTYLRELASTDNIELDFSPVLSKSIRLKPGKLIGIIGASGQGKSTLAEHIAMEFLQQKKKVFVVSQEMLPEEFSVKLLRMVRNEPLDDPSYVRTLPEETINTIVKQTQTLVSLVNMTDSFGAVSISSIDKQIHQLTAAGRHPHLVIIDHLLAITENSEAATILQVCRDLKDLARRHKTIVVILSHTKKVQKGGRISPPDLDDAYGSSGLPMFADLVLSVASDKEISKTYIKTVKLERMGGAYVSLTYDYKDYCLVEEVAGARASYNDEIETEEKEYY